MVNVKEPIVTKMVNIKEPIITILLVNGIVYYYDIYGRDYCIDTELVEL